MSDNIGNLEEEALKRKERLKALKRGELTSIRKQGGDDEDDDENGVELFPKPIFRNYNPKDESLKERVLPKPNLIEIENEIKEKLESGKPESLIEKEIDLTTLAPQKVDWDLKRDIEKKLKILEKRTQKAIIELIQERLKGQKEKADLAELVSIGTRKNVKKALNDSDGNENADNDDDDDDEEEDDDEEVAAVGKEFSKSQLEDENSQQRLDEPNTKTEISDDDDY